MLQIKLFSPSFYESSLKYHNALHLILNLMDLEISLGSVIGHNDKSGLQVGSSHSSQMMDTRTGTKEESKSYLIGSKESHWQQSIN